MNPFGNGARTRRPRIAGAALGACAAILLATGCSEAEAPASSDELTEEGAVSITWYGSDARNQAVQTVVDGWVAETPEAEVTTQPTTFDAYWDRLSVQASGGSMACVVAMQSRYEARYESRGSLLALDGLIDSGVIDVSGIPETLLESQRAADGNLYVIPYGIWYEGVTLNAPLIEQYGLTVPDADTWDGYVEWGAEAAAALPDDSWPISDRGGEITQFQAFAISRGENLFEDGELAFSEETLSDWFALWSGAIADGVVPPAQTTAEQVGVPTPQSMQAQGRVLLASNGDNNISDVQLTLDENGLGTVSILPSPTGDSPQVVGTNGWAVSENCTNTKQATAFIDHFVNSTEGASVLQAQTGLPPVTAVLEEQLADAQTSEAIKQRGALYEQLLDDGAVVDVWPDGTQQLVTQFRTAYEEVAFGRMSAEESSATFRTQAETALTGF